MLFILSVTSEPFPTFFSQQKTMISQSVLVTTLLLLATEINSEILPKADCPTSCGNLNIPFPFGTTTDCSLDDSFLIYCNYSYNPPKAFLKSGSIEVFEISLDGLMEVSSSVASDCYDDSGAQTNGSISELISSKFLNSSTQDKFTVNNRHLHVGGLKWKQMSGNFRVNIPNRYSGAFEISSSYYKCYHDDLGNTTVSLTLDWSVRNATCQEAQKNHTTYACRARHSECSDSEYGFGYRCKCLTGFQGNPYLVNGCQDIDECATLRPCKRRCTNLVGSYFCSCPKGFEGDGKNDGTGCRPKSQKSNASILFYIAFAFMIPAVGISWIFWRHKKTKLIQLRQNLFKRNGGWILENLLSRQRTLHIFTAEDLKKATDNYKETRILYRNEYREITYKGILPDPQNSEVTILKCYELEECESCDIVVFVSKLVTLSRMNNENVVKLIGCCLETQVPLLVFESVNTKTLYDYIHDDYCGHFLSWDIRLRIAAETAGALAYMHSATSQVPIIHGNLNSYSITLNHNYTVKLHDFGLTNQISGFQLRHTFGYLDPEYFFSGRLTVKSDVYSFGVVLAELLTGKKVISFERLDGEEHLSKYFVSLPRGDDLLRILDHRLVVDGKIEQLTEVAKLAQRCLSNSSVERPTMKDVVIALKHFISWNSTSTIISPNSTQSTASCRLLRRNRSF